MELPAEPTDANPSWWALGKVPNLPRRIAYTVFILIVFRLGTYIPVPGIDSYALYEILAYGTPFLLERLNDIGGGALSRMSLFALGIMPFINAWIIVQLLAFVISPWRRLRKEGERGRKTLRQYIRYGAVGLAIVQGYGVAMAIQNAGLAQDPGLYFIATCVSTLVGGTVLLMWMCEEISARGIGNGFLLIILVGILVKIPSILESFLAQ
jgi:preprotein translocase subunit SecY